MDKRETFEQFYKQNYAAFFMQAFHLIGDEEACRDYVSDCFEFAWNHFEELSTSNNFGYIRQMLRNKCIDHLRHEEVKGKYIEFYKRMADVDNDYREQEQLLQRIYGIIEKMKPPTGKIVEEVFLNKKRYKEVAEEMGISTSTVKKHISKALQQIRLTLNGRLYRFKG